jgi:hypothetical protein
LAIAIVLVAGLSMGGGLIRWWATDPADVLSRDHVAPAVTLPSMGQSLAGVTLSLEFGNTPYAIEREIVRGDRSSAEAKLTDTCRRILQSNARPLVPIEEGERKVLAAIERQKPVDEQPGLWRIDRIAGPTLMFVGTRGKFSEQTDETSSNGQRVQPRVVCWGLVLSDSEKGWTLFTFRPAASSEQTELFAVALPESARRLVSVRTDDGGALIGFDGNGPAKKWMNYFDRWFATRGWEPARIWSANGAQWSARYLGRYNSVAMMADVQFSRSGNAGFAGLLNITPRPDGLKERGRP